MSGHHVLRVAYAVPDMGIGGAERHVTTLMSHLDRERFDPIVICLGRQCELFASLAASDVPAVALGRSKREAFACLIDLVRKLRETSPDVVVVRGYSAEVLGRVAAVLAGVPRVIVWVHNCGDLQPRGVLRRICDVGLEPVTDAYVGVAHTQVPDFVRELRYSPRKVRIIHNGVDPSSFTGAVDGDLMAQLGLHGDELVIGILAAFRPEKDHETFLRAASLVSERYPAARFMIVGDGRRKEPSEALADELGILDRVTFPSARNDVAAVLAVMEVFVLSSFTIECFPMALLDQHSSPNDPKGLERILDARDVLSPFVGDASTLAILREYRVDYVVLNQRNERPTSFDYWTLQPAIYGAMKAKFDAHPQWFHLAWQAPKIWVHEVTAAAERGPLPPDVEPERPFARAWPRRSAGSTPLRDREFLQYGTRIEPDVASPGDTLTITTAWALAGDAPPPAGSYQVFMRLETSAPRGALHAEAFDKLQRKLEERIHSMRWRVRESHLPLAGGVRPGPVAPARGDQGSLALRDPARRCTGSLGRPRADDSHAAISACASTCATTTPSTDRLWAA